MRILMLLLICSVVAMSQTAKAQTWYDVHAQVNWDDDIYQENLDQWWDLSVDFKSPSNYRVHVKWQTWNGVAWDNAGDSYVTENAFNGYATLTKSFPNGTKVRARCQIQDDEASMLTEKDELETDHRAYSTNGTTPYYDFGYISGETYGTVYNFTDSSVHTMHCYFDGTNP